ncbi:hypothetical protein NDU88_007490 [Pleurodeles waltl]|uniref:Uncharacterized protein n=1 Tax=Pleurodeles waltl TaxID=8319 RepID=A0AAV7NWE2_PLEWA|nr:hypothetical protein NDU88_007490 [Pleurodeles waltl]
MPDPAPHHFMQIGSGEKHLQLFACLVSSYVGHCSFLALRLGESSKQRDPLTVEDTNIQNEGPDGWALVQQTLTQLTQEIKERFAISKVTQKGIQTTCSNLETKIENLTQRTQELE